MYSSAPHSCERSAHQRVSRMLMLMRQRCMWRANGANAGSSQLLLSGPSPPPLLPAPSAVHLPQQRSGSAGGWSVRMRGTPW